GQVRTGHARRRARAGQVVLDTRLAALRPEAAGDPVELRVALDACVMRREVPRLGGEVLERDVLELCVRLDEQLRDGIRVRLRRRIRRRILLDQGRAGA